MQKPVTGNLRGLPVFLTALVIAAGCRDIAVPRPKGYFRIDMPPKEYRLYNGRKELSELPLNFEYPVYGNISYESENKSETGWFNIEFPGYHARIYLTYKNVNNDLAELIEQTYTMNVKNHIAKADAINEQVIKDDKNRIYGILYDLKGNTASAVQFYVTDSTNHYLRGSLYFESEPNADSLEPVIGFLREDIIHLIETLNWENNK